MGILAFCLVALAVLSLGFCVAFRMRQPDELRMQGSLLKDMVSFTMVLESSGTTQKLPDQVEPGPGDDEALRSTPPMPEAGNPRRMDRSVRVFAVVLVPPCGTYFGASGAGLVS